MGRIQEIKARQLIDCKRRPMIEVDVITDDGFAGTGSAPTGSSVGMYESFVLRDNDLSNWNGMSVHKAVANITDLIAPALIGMDVHDQTGIDNKMIELDGTEFKSRLGGNAIYSVSVAALRAAAACEGMPVYRYLAGRDIKTVPVPTFNMINGGLNFGIRQAFNEFIIVPFGTDSVDHCVEMGCAIFEKLGSAIEEAGFSSYTGRSYGYTAPSEDPGVVLGIMQKAVEKCGYDGKVCFALDCASGEMYDKETGTYYLNGRRLTGDELLDYMEDLTKNYPFLFIEDLFDENDWEHFVKAKNRLKKNIILGDDLTATSPERIRKAYEMQALDGFILKPNQIGTLTEAFDAYRYAKDHNMLAITSGRAGGVIGDIVMDLGVAFELPFMKNGAPRSGERIDKLNFILRACDKTPGCHLASLDGIIKCCDKQKSTI